MGYIPGEEKCILQVTGRERITFSTPFLPHWRLIPLLCVYQVGEKGEKKLCSFAFIFTYLAHGEL